MGTKISEEQDIETQITERLRIPFNLEESLSLKDFNSKHIELMHKVIREKYGALLFSYVDINEQQLRIDMTWLYEMEGLPPPDIVIHDDIKSFSSQCTDLRLSGLVLWNSQWINKALMINNEFIRTHGDFFNEAGFFSRHLEDPTDFELILNIHPFVRHTSYYGIALSTHALALAELVDNCSKQRSDDRVRLGRILYNGLWIFRLYTTACVVCRMPLRMLRDETGRLHSIEQPAVQWKSGFNQYYIFGVRFSRELWEKIQQRTLTTLEVVSLVNIEQRQAAFKVYGAEKILNDLDSELISKTKRNELHKVHTPLGVLKLLKYTCPSTQRVYVKFVPNELEDADEAQAWSFGLTKQEYQLLEFES